MPLRAGAPASFLVVENTAKNQGLLNTTSLYFLEEVASRAGLLRVTFFTQAGSESEARNRLKNLQSLCAMLS